MAMNSGASGGVTDRDVHRIVSLLRADVRNTVGRDYGAVVETTAAHVRQFTTNPGDFEERVVDEVQQYLHDTFVDTSWPRCPAHLNHPLWYSESSWRCGQTGETFGQLGTLSSGDEMPPAAS